VLHDVVHLSLDEGLAWPAIVLTTACHVGTASSVGRGGQFVMLCRAVLYGSVHELVRMVL